ncbi:MAG TPA: EamA family transporter [Ruminococcaceae bacterium]|nr:EamA family transporter [Oscillospiraceae bacterium]
MKKLKLNNTNKGIILIIASAFCFALMGMFVRLAGDLPAMQKSFFRNIVALFFSLTILLKEHEKIAVPKSTVKYLLLRAFFGTIGIVCNFYAIGKLVLADASILNKMSPFFAILGSLVILKEKISPKKAAIVITAFIGCLFVIKPTFRNAELIPSLIGLLGGFGAGIAYTMVHKLGQEKVKGSFIVFFFSVFSTLVFLPFMIVEYKHMTVMQLVFLLLAGLSATGGQYTITAAYIFAPARDISVYDYSQIIFSSLLGLFVFGQIPDIFSIIGYVIIIAMAAAMFFLNRKTLKNT